MATSSQAPSVARLRTHQSGRLSLVSSFRGKLVATHFWDFCNTTGTKLTCRLPATPSPGQSSMIAGDRMGCCCRFGVFPHSCNTWCFATRRAAFRSSNLRRCLLLGRWVAPAEGLRCGRISRIIQVARNRTKPTIGRPRPASAHNLACGTSSILCSRQKSPLKSVPKCLKR